MIVWLNGPFGVGKRRPRERCWKPSRAGHCSPEQVGSMLRHTLAKLRPVPDFQDWASWRRVVVASLAALHDELENTIVVPQTVVIETYWREVAGLRAHGLPLSAFTLHANRDAHEHRIDSDTVEVEAAGWRRLRRADYDAALGWLSARTTIIDTTRLTPAEVVASVRESVDKDNKR